MRPSSASKSRATFGCFLLLLLCLTLPAGSTRAQVFSQVFNNTATSRNDANSFILTYLSAAVYPERLQRLQGRPHSEQIASSTIRRDLNVQSATFESQFRTFAGRFFDNATIRFVHECDGSGLNPEAVVISTASTIWVVFRGTDQVECATDVSNPEGFNYTWNEWIKTDFDFGLIAMADVPGRVHAGFANSLNVRGFKDSLFHVLRSLGGHTKKVWITGHSLGGAHAQIFALWLSKQTFNPIQIGGTSPTIVSTDLGTRGTLTTTAKVTTPTLSAKIVPQGVWVYASPNPGNAAFAADLEATFPEGRLQRFEFRDDPVTLLTNATPSARNLLATLPAVGGSFSRSFPGGYAAAGTRVLYQNINTMYWDVPERFSHSNDPGWSLFNTISALASAGSICYHDTWWYVRAAFNQLSNTEKQQIRAGLNVSGFPPIDGPLFLPTVPVTNQQRDIYMACLDEDGIRRGRGENRFDLGATIMNTIASLGVNTTSRLADGNYFIRPWVSKGRLELKNSASPMTDGSAISVGDKDEVRLESAGLLPGYRIKMGTRRDGNDLFGNPVYRDMMLDSKVQDALDEVTTVQTWTRNPVGEAGPMNWYLVPLGGDAYLIVNVNTLKALTVSSGALGGNSATVTSKAIENGNLYQIWMITKN